MRQKLFDEYERRLVGQIKQAQEDVERDAADARRFRYLHSYLSAHPSTFTGMSLDSLREWCDRAESGKEGADDDYPENAECDECHSEGTHKMSCSQAPWAGERLAGPASVISDLERAERYMRAAAERVEDETAGSRIRHAVGKMAARRLRGYADLYQQGEIAGVPENVITEAIRESLIQEIEDMLERM